jgi:L-rhamnose-H+ transport protein
MITSNPILGVLFHAVGALSAALCYTPQKATRRWSWQTYWLAQASVCWLILPVLGAWLTIPDLVQLLKQSPASAMRNAFLLGACYGIGGTAFGLAIKHLGFSLTYAIAIGICCVLVSNLQNKRNNYLGVHESSMHPNYSLSDRRGRA